MTKSELIERFAKRYPHLVIKDAEVVVQTILDVMCNSLMGGQRVEIRGFGVFNLIIACRAMAEIRNPGGRQGPCQVCSSFQGRQGIARTSKNQISPTQFNLTDKVRYARFPSSAIKLNGSGAVVLMHKLNV
jgi:nucleoid DNA-binding protein